MSREGGGREGQRKEWDIDIEHTLRYTKDKHIVLYDYNTIVMKHFVSKETKKKKLCIVFHNL